MQLVEDNPSLWCISYQQLLDVEDLARGIFGDEMYWNTVTMRDICDKIILPRCQKTKTSYALSLNPGGLSGIGDEGFSFVTHSWDGQFASFVQSIKIVFQTTIQKPNLWICAFALHQIALGKQLHRHTLEDFPFVKALQDATSFCVVRNSSVDLYIWTNMVCL